MHMSIFLRNERALSLPSPKRLVFVSLKKKVYTDAPLNLNLFVMLLALLRFTGLGAA